MSRGPSTAVPARYLQLLKALPADTEIPGDARAYLARLKGKETDGKLPLTFLEREVLDVFAAKFQKSESSVEVAADGSVRVKHQNQQAQVMSGEAANFNMQKEAFDAVVRLEGKFIEELRKTQGNSFYENLITKQQTTYEALLSKETERADKLQARVDALEQQNAKGWKKLSKAQKKTLKLQRDIKDRELESLKLLDMLETADQLLEHKDSLKNPSLELIESPQVKEALNLASKIISIIENKNKALN